MIKSLSNPPPDVHTLLSEVIGIMEGKKAGPWTDCLKALANPTGLLAKFAAFDPDSLDSDGVARVKALAAAVDVDVINKKSSAAGGLAVWAHALAAYLEQEEADRKA